MKTIIMEFNTEDESVAFLKEKQLNYSFAFRKCYKNYHKLKDIQFINFIKDNFKMNDIEFRSVATEVKTRFKQTTTFKKDLENEKHADFLAGYCQHTLFHHRLLQSGKEKRKLLSKGSDLY